MASVSSSTSSLGNTLRGLSTGMSSGINRDEIIEQMTLATTSRIQKEKNAMTKLNWRQEVFQSISGKMLDIQDNFFSYSSGFNMKSADSFAKNLISTLGKEDVKGFVSATGTSNMVSYLSVSGVQQTATQARRVSDQKGSSDIATTIDETNLDTQTVDSSNLKGTQLRFSTVGADGKLSDPIVFTFPDSYTIEKDDPNNPGKKIQVKEEINYIEKDPEKLVEQLNKAAENFNLGKDETTGKAGKITFELDDNGNIKINATDPAKGYVIRDSSSALKALGFDTSAMTGGDKADDGISFAEFNNDAYKSKTFQDASVTKTPLTDYLVGKKLSFTYGGQTKEIELITSAEKGTVTSVDDLVKNINKRLEKAFGSKKVEAFNDGGKLVFQSIGDSSGKSQLLKVTSNDNEVRQAVGIAANASNYLSMDDSLWNNREKLGFTGYGDDDKAAFEAFLKNDFKINGVSFDLSADMTLNAMKDKINSNSDAEVTVSYMANENQLLIMGKETGSGREITLGGAADTIFGTTNGTGRNEDGKDAIVEVSYGNGLNTTIVSSSNTFELEGLRVTVSGEFGYKKNANGEIVNAEGKTKTEVGNNWKPQLDASQAITFSAKADVDAATEQVKKFVEAYNEMIEEIKNQISTRPDKSYGVLSDEQKSEMTEKEVENWETKAKSGLLYGDTIMRELSMSMQNVVNKLAGMGIDKEDMAEIGISFEEGWSEGGTITFDEAKFKSMMETEPDKVAKVFAGDGGNTGLAQAIEDTLTPYATRYATRNGGSYGRLVEEAGSSKIPLSATNNHIYRQLEEMKKGIETLNAKLKTEQDRYISRFSNMELLINQMNTQASYLSDL